MPFVADIHLHSHFSRATSKNLNLEHLSKWAQFKGVQVVGTGDIAHPGWLAEMKSKLEPAEEGLFALKDECDKAIRSEVFKACQRTVRFMLAGELSNIYKKHDKVRKIHHVVFFPSFEAVEKFQARLEKIGNIRSDGRPILGLDSRDLLEIVLETDPQGYLIPAHIWTPWFALLGSMSGFDSVEECFDDLTPHIFAVETGLSSDPPMNWRLSALDRYTLVSNSDAHSPPKLGREANIFTSELSYPAIFDALKTGDPTKFGGTIEFFPEEGKYHYDGHRKCGIRWHPEETMNHNIVCEVCGKPVTVGVMHRVEKLADRKSDYRPENRHPFKSLIPLPEILAEMYDVGVGTKRVTETYEILLSKLGPELEILIQIPLDEIERVGGTLLAEGIRRVRVGEIKIAAGYDGEYGTIGIFTENEREYFSAQLGFFESTKVVTPPLRNGTKVSDDAVDYLALQKHASSRDAISVVPTIAQSVAEVHPLLRDLNSHQRQAVESTDAALMIVAGPGTGKTATLTRRIAYLVDQQRALPENILAVTFTNKAAEEMRHRLKTWLSVNAAAKPTVRTLHAFGAMILKADGHLVGVQPNFTILKENEQARLLKSINSEFGERAIASSLNRIALAKNLLLTPEASSSHERFQNAPDFAAIYAAYQCELQKINALDFDDLCFLPVQLFEQFPEVLRKYHRRYSWIFVDEYQDLNFSQYQLLRKLVTPDSGVCVIGDPDQAIYGFRGASREFFLCFHEDFPHAKIISLDKNYRSPQLILDAATQMIARGSDSNTSRLISEIISDERLQIHAAFSEKAEAEQIVHEIEKMMGGTSYFSLDSGRVQDGANHQSKSFSEFAVLYRLNAQSRVLREAFDRSGIPYQTIGETPFFERDEVRIVMCYLWFLYNPNSDIHLEVILRDRLSVARVKPIIASAKARGITLWQALVEETKKKSAHGNAQTRAAQELISYLESVDKKSICEIIERVIESFIFKEKDDAKKASVFERLILKSKPFERNLGDFLNTTALASEADEYDPRSDRVTLMTLHAAKGLEFPVVFVAGCEENLIPYLKTNNQSEIDEERRLFYVGMTRARRQLVLSYSKSRLLFGQKMSNSPSRFLNDIESRLKELKEMRVRPRRDEQPDPQMRLF
jgi:uncharacterized protein (TIGR00375 family)